MTIRNWMFFDSAANLIESNQIGADFNGTNVQPHLPLTMRDTSRCLRSVGFNPRIAVDDFDRSWALSSSSFLARSMPP
jgi:hypothetical protein